MPYVETQRSAPHRGALLRYSCREYLILQIEIGDMARRHLHLHLSPPFLLDLDFSPLHVAGFFLLKNNMITIARAEVSKMFTLPRRCLTSLHSRLTLIPDFPYNFLAPI